MIELLKYKINIYKGGSFMTASQIREKARESLTGKWGKASLMTLCYFVITYAIGFLCGFIPFIGSIALLVIEFPISYGIISSFIKLKRNEDVGYVDFLSIAFSSIGNVWKVIGNILLKMIVPIIILIVIYFLFILLGVGTFVTINTMQTIEPNSSAILGASAGIGVFAIILLIAYIAIFIWLMVKGYLYSLSLYILHDRPNSTGKEIVEESERLMRGNRWKYFCLGLSFIGWIFLSAFSLYIGLLWVLPYMFISTVCFYEHLSEKV